MKNPAIIILLIIFSLAAFSQTPGQIVANKNSETSSTTKKSSGDESEEYQRAVGQINAADRITALQKFVKDFPESKNKINALELIVSSRAALADEKLRMNEIKSGVELFKIAVIEAPTPISDKLFSEVILQFPTNLFFRGQSDEAFEVAKLIEAKAEGNPKQLLGVATYYLGTESGEEAKRVAQEVIEISPELPAAYQTLGLANRIMFDLQASADAYAKALELDPASVVSRRSLAEMKRAIGKSNEAVKLYQEILEVNPSDSSSQTGLILSLFNAGKKEEAEAQMTKAFEQNPRNLVLLVGAAYWYAANGNGAKAVDFAERAVAIEPRYTWAQIALARGLVEQKRPLDAERALLNARQYGNFPTLDYEMASVRLSAGLFREAADELKKSFVVRDGKIMTYLGGQVFKEADNFIDLLGAERRASIFEPNSADTIENAEKLESLLKLKQELESPEIAETKVTKAVDEFVTGDDNMKLHRQLFAANQLLDRKIALPKALELTKAATGGVDSALNVISPASAVLAEEIYDGRKLALARNEVLIVPEIPRQTLSKILRGRIEEITGWALFQQANPSEAILRLRRAVSVLPEKSAWWRSSMWRLGSALESDGKAKEALNAYIASYDPNAQTQGKRFIIELLYRKVNGNLDGLDKLIGANPFVENKTVDEETTAQNTENAVSIEPTPTPTPVSTPTPLPTPRIPDRVPVAKNFQSKTQNTNIVKTNTNAEPISTPQTKEINNIVVSDENVSVQQSEESTDDNVAEQQTEQLTDEDVSKQQTEESNTDDVSGQQIAEKSNNDISEVVDKGIDNSKVNEALENFEDLLAISENKELTDLPETEKSADLEPTPTPTPENLDSEKEDPLTDLTPTPTLEMLDSNEDTSLNPTPTPTPEVLDLEEDTSETQEDVPIANVTPTPTPENLELEESIPLIRVTPSPTPEVEVKTDDDSAESETDVTPSPTPESGNLAVVIENIISNREKSDPLTEKTEVKPDDKMLQKETEDFGIGAKTAKSSSPLFEPIIIKVPKEAKRVSSQTNDDFTDLNLTENTESKTKPDENPVKNPVDPNKTRPRVIITENNKATGTLPPTEEIKPCNIEVSQKSIALINGGGSMVVLVSMEDKKGLSELKATTKNPNDVKIIFEPEIGGASGQAIYIIKSISENKGEYTVTFEAPCGKKDISVKVR